MMAADIATATLLLAGALFMLLAALGVLRLPDFLTRLSATSKAATLGAACMLLAGAAHLGGTGVSIRALAAIGFLFVTAPIAAHTIARAAYLSGVPLWRGTRCDDLRGRYDAITHRLAGGTEPAPPSEPRGDEAPRPDGQYPGNA